MHLIGAWRKRFLTIFFIKRIPAEKVLSVLADCDPTIVEKAVEPRNYPDADLPATLVARAD
jgi:hypothetical protein